MYALSLEIAGFVVRGTGSATHALELLKAETPDIVVTDISMPDMDGVELCRRIREIPHLRAVPILAVTGHSSEKTLADMSAAGACAVCQKPLPGDGLARAVRSLLAERPTCLACWETGAPFRQVSFGGPPSGWLRHEPVEPDTEETP